VHTTLQWLGGQLPIDEQEGFRRQSPCGCPGFHNQALTCTKAKAGKLFLKRTKKRKKRLDTIVFIFGIWHSQIRKNFNLNWQKK